MRTTWMKRLIVATMGATATLLTFAAVPTDADAGWLDKLLEKLRNRNRYQQRAVPEIDPSVVAGAVALVSGGIAILRDRRRRD